MFPPPRAGVVRRGLLRHHRDHHRDHHNDYQRDHHHDYHHHGTAGNHHAAPQSGEYSDEDDEFKDTVFPQQSNLFALNESYVFTGLITANPDTAIYTGVSRAASAAEDDSEDSNAADVSHAKRPTPPAMWWTASIVAWWCFLMSTVSTCHPRSPPF